MLSKPICGTLTLLLLPVGLMAQPADGRFGAYPGGPDMLSWITDSSHDIPRRPTVERPAIPYRYPYKRYAFSYQAFATGPADWTPGYSYPYGYASSWYPYSSWHGLGNSDSVPSAFPDYDYSIYSPIPSVHGAPLETAYRAAPPDIAAATYTGPSSTAPAYTRASFAAGLTSRITVTAPAGADIYLEGVKVASGGRATHAFQTPPLNPDQQYRYHVRAVWTGLDGQTVDQKQDVAFSAGAGVAVRFPTAATMTRTLQSY